MRINHDKTFIRLYFFKCEHDLAPTVIIMEALGEYSVVIDQGDYGCKLTNRRGPTDVSTVNILHIQRITRRMKITQLICSKNLYNKGGYMIVTGNAADGFQCAVYRD